MVLWNGEFDPARRIAIGDADVATRAIAVSPCSNFVAVGGSGMRPSVWDARTGERSRELPVKTVLVKTGQTSKLGFQKQTFMPNWSNLTTKNGLNQ